MDYREEATRILMDGIDEDSVKMIYGVARAARRHMEERKEAGDYAPPELSNKMETVRLLLEINDERFIKAIYMSVCGYVEEKGGAA